MSYFEKLKRDKENDIKYQKEAESLKIAVFDINSLYSIHDGEFLEDLLELIKKWKKIK